MVERSAVVVWPADILTRATGDSNAEKRVLRELFALGVEANNDFDIVLKKFGLHKARRVCAWISRFNHSSRHPCEKIIGPLTIKEIQQQKNVLDQATTELRGKDG